MTAHLYPALIAVSTALLTCPGELFQVLFIKPPLSETDVEERKRDFDAP